MEGKQAKLYRQNFSDIVVIASSSPFYHHMSQTVHWFDRLMSNIGKSDCWVDENCCNEAAESLKQLH